MACTRCKLPEMPIVKHRSSDQFRADADRAARNGYPSESIILRKSADVLDTAETVLVRSSLKYVCRCALL